MARDRRCPCGSLTPYGDCCGALHRGARAAATAEELMRSRYSAYVVHDEGHLLRSWHPATRPASIGFDDDLRWTGLEIVATEAGGTADVDGVVEFRAHHTVAGEPGVLHEVSRFRRHDGAWTYVRGRS
ncbi:YchJ family protein [Nocardioides sp. MH1]|uniref:YchJ family protein n=1 Tax=Nocardioides sp. MH1 TaxID=3242490 RepID=UPI0035226B5C